MLPRVSCPTWQNCVFPSIIVWLFSDIFFSKTLQQFLLSNKEAILGAGRYQRGRSKVGFNLRSKPQMAALRKPMTRFGGIFLPENSCFCSFGPKMGEYFTFHLTLLTTMITRIFETIAQMQYYLFFKNTFMFFTLIGVNVNPLAYNAKGFLFLPRGMHARLVSVNQYPVKWLWTDQRL